MLTTVAPLVVLLLAMAVVGVFAFTRLAQTLVEQRDAELVQLAAGQIADYFRDSVLLLTQVSATEAARNGDAVAMQDLLQADVALRERFDQLCVTDAQGLVLASVGEVGSQFGELSYFERARRLRRPVRSSLYEDARGHQLVTVAVPVFDIYGQFVGCVLGVWDLARTQLGLPVASVRVGQGGYAYLVNENGVVLYHPSAGFIGGDGLYHPAVQALMQGKAGAQTVSVDGRVTVVGYAPIAFHRLSSSLLADESWEDWGLLTNELWDDLMAPLSLYVWLLVALLLAIVAAPLILLAINSHRVSAPLESLARQADRVASGEYDSEVSINSGPSEVQDLEEAFNLMVQRLRQSRSDIQDYVVSILNTQERERKRIARELHDETAQALIVLGREIEMAEELATSGELREELSHLRDGVDATLQGVRRFTRDLRPPLLEELGLSRSLEILVDRLDRTEPFHVMLSIVGQPYPLLPEAELGIYRLAQEGLSNVRRHAAAKNVEVIFTYGPRQVTLEIIDDGIGFDAAPDTKELVRMGRLGIMGMHERVRLFGGKARIDSQVGQGTRVRVEIPLTSIVLPPNGDGLGARR
jgi:signal transduction histidine kinase